MSYTSITVLAMDTGESFQGSNQQTSSVPLDVEVVRS